MRKGRLTWTRRRALAVLCALLALWFEVRPPHTHDVDPPDGVPDLHRPSGPCSACVAATALPVVDEVLALSPPAVVLPSPPPRAGVHPCARQLLLQAPKHGPPA